MTVVVDINVLLDVFQKRQPHYAASAAVVNQVMNGVLKGVCAAHALTTLYYIARKHGGQPEAEKAVDAVLDFFEIQSLEKSGWQHARALPLKDFEDAAIAATAEQVEASFIVTRNEDDFELSPVPAISPAAFLSRFMADNSFGE